MALGDPGQLQTGSREDDHAAALPGRGLQKPDCPSGCRARGLSVLSFVGCVQPLARQRRAKGQRRWVQQSVDDFAVRKPANWLAFSPSPVRKRDRELLAGRIARPGHCGDGASLPSRTTRSEPRPGSPRLAACGPPSTIVWSCVGEAAKAGTSGGCSGTCAAPATAEHAEQPEGLRGLVRGARADASPSGAHRGSTDPNLATPRRL